MRILTWHVHGSYLYYLSQVPHTIYVPMKVGRPHGYGGRAGPFPWPDNLVEVPADHVRDLDLDVVLFQSRTNWEIDQHEILTAEQRSLPRIYLEHDPPREHPTDTAHVVDDPDVLMVHVTAFNDLMWNSNRTPTKTIDHGVVMPPHVRYTGEIERGIVVINGLGWRGRRLGLDVFLRVREQIPLDLAGMESEDLGGLGDIPLAQLHELVASYRFFFNPIRYTSLGLAVCEAMMIGLPIVALATTEMATVVRNGVNGYADTNVDALIPRMRDLLDDPEHAAALSKGARATAVSRFDIARFVANWEDAFRVARAMGPAGASAPGRAG